MKDQTEENTVVKRRSTRKARTRARLCEAALKVFFEHGYADATIEEIARTAGVRRSTLYTHFRDKEDILGAIAGGYLEQISQIVGLLPSPRPSRRQIDRWIEEFAAFAMREPEATRLLIPFSLDLNAPPVIEEFGRELMQLYADHLPAFADALRPGQDRAWARATAVLRELSWALCHHIEENGGGRSPYMLEVAADPLEQLVKGWF